MRTHSNPTVPREDAASAQDHVVQFYETDEFLCEHVARYFGEGLALNEGAVAIATPPHRARIRELLAARGFDPDALIARGQLVMTDAAQTLTQFMVGGMPDEERFRQVVGGLLDTFEGRGVRAFGEMVDLLWRDGNRRAALQLEELWNDLRRARAFHILCAYVMGGFYKHSGDGAYEAVCALHRHVLPPERELGVAPDALTLDGLRLRNEALADEVTHRRQLEAALRDVLRDRERVERALAEALAREQQQRKRVQFLADASLALTESLDLTHTLERVAELAVPALADWCAISLLGDDQRLRCVALQHRHRARLEDAGAYARRVSTPDGDAFQRAAMHTGRGRLWAQLGEDELRTLAEDEEHLRLLGALGCASVVAVPLVQRGNPLGVISLVVADGARRLDEDDVLIAEELARRACIAVDHARTLREADRAQQEKRRQTDVRLDLLIESIQDYAVFMLDPKGRVTSWNPGAQRINGYGASDIIGRHFSTFYREEEVRAGKCEMELEVAARTGRFEDLGWRVRKDGSEFWANVVISAIRDEHGRLVGFSKVTRDLTDRKRAEEDQAARRAAEEANRAKDEFLAMLGHELRNPLAPIVTALQLMKLRGDVRSSKEQQIIDRQVKHVVRLVDDLLDISRITRGKIELKRHPIDVRDVMAKAIEIASPMLEQRRHHFDVEVPPHPIVVEADEARLAQVFANLLTNAAKYTEPGGHIVVEVRQVDREAVVEVRDDGAGIPPELLPRMFELFVQGQQGAERSSGGLGIGLNLVRTLVHMHGGTVEAHSAGSGEGSTFVVRLPVSASQPSAQAHDAPPAVTQPHAGTRRVLLVDDNADAVDLLAEVLRAAGHEVVTALDAVEAIGHVQAQVPDVAILDIGLPVMDGYELAARLRAELGARTPPLIALTGYGQPTDRARSDAAGFATHLVKPIEPRELLELIDKLPKR